MTDNPILRMRRSLGRWRRLRQREIERIDFIDDVYRRIPNLAIHTIFDVGANIGMTALLFSDAWPKATVYAFEPSAKNRSLMKSNLVGKAGIKIVPAGLSDQIDTAELLYDVEHPTMSRLGDGKGERESVQLDTADAFTAKHGITSIDLMKIDVEGHEEQVLRGATSLLTRGAINIVKAECAIDPDHTYHTQLSTITDILHPFGYRLFGFYEQTEDVFNPGPRIRRFDVAFISPNVFSG